MTRLEWNQAGERLFETGIDQVVLYSRTGWGTGPGVAWNGVVGVSENINGGDVEPLYFDGVKYADVLAAEDFGATLEAYSAPDEFAQHEGSKQLSPGLFATQQPRKPFGLCYRTLIGNDLVSTEYGYKLHIVYNCMVAPSGRTYKTLGGSVNPDTRSWAIHTTPPDHLPMVATDHKPTAHLVVDSRLATPANLELLEDTLYGIASEDGYLPIVEDVVEILALDLP